MGFSEAAAMYNRHFEQEALVIAKLQFLRIRRSTLTLMGSAVGLTHGVLFFTVVCAQHVGPSLII